MVHLAPTPATCFSSISPNKFIRLTPPSLTAPPLPIWPLLPQQVDEFKITGFLWVSPSQLGAPLPLLSPSCPHAFCYPVPTSLLSAALRSAQPPPEPSIRAPFHFRSFPCTLLGQNGPQSRYRGRDHVRVTLPGFPGPGRDRMPVRRGAVPPRSSEQRREDDVGLRAGHQATAAPAFPLGGPQRLAGTDTPLARESCDF